jgi:hypothetical protein
LSDRISTVGVPLFHLPKEDGFVTAVVDESGAFDGAQRKRAICPHFCFIRRGVSPVRALSHQATSLKPKSDAVVETAIRVAFDVNVNWGADLGECNLADHVNLIFPDGKGFQRMVVLDAATAPSRPICVGQLRHRENAFLMVFLASLLSHFCQETKVISLFGDLPASRCILAFAAVSVQNNWWWRCICLQSGDRFHDGFDPAVQRRQ